MINVKMPVLMDSSLQESAILYPTKGNLKLKANDISEAQLTLGDKSTAVPMHAWVKIYNQNGFVGFFRRTGRNSNIAVDRSITLRHGIDILNDSVWEGQEDFEGTLTEYLTAILSHQTALINGVRPWVLGTCADARNVAKSLNYNNLFSLLKECIDTGSDYYFTYDQTVWPWEISLVAKPSGVRSEFRLNRNIEKCRITDNDSELCTRLILNVNKAKENADPDTPDEQQSVWRVYNNSAAQANFGIITKTADIDVTQDTLPGGPFPEADAWAADFLAKRAEPQLQIQIDGLQLNRITGDSWDETTLCELCRVALPEYSAAISQRVVTITYTDLYGAPERISVSLANTLPNFTDNLTSLARETAALASDNRYYERQESYFKKYFSILDRQGNILHQAGLELDAYGMLVYADDGENMVGSRFEVQADRIGMVVGTIDGANYIKAGEICLAINASTGQSEAKIDADHVYIGNEKSTTVIAGKAEVSDLNAATARITQLEADAITANTLSAAIANLAAVTITRLNATAVYASGTVSTPQLIVGTKTAEWQDTEVVIGVTHPVVNTSPDYMFVDTGGTGHYGALVISKAGGGVTTKTLHYLGQPET